MNSEAIILGVGAWQIVNRNSRGAKNGKNDVNY